MRLFAAALLALGSAQAADLIVAAASDLAPLTAALEKGFGPTLAPGVVRFTLGSSGTLAKQVENGAPFDVFLSANDQYVKDLAASGHLDPATVVVYATGRVALWS